MAQEPTHLHADSKARHSQHHDGTVEVAAVGQPQVEVVTSVDGAVVLVIAASTIKERSATMASTIG